MIGKNSCGHVRQLLALEAGQDLVEQDREGVRQHLDKCAPCRDHFDRVQAGRQVLEQVRAGTTGNGASYRSMWPEVKARLLARQSRAAALGRPAFNGWLPIGALAAACIAILVVADGGTPTSDRTAFQAPYNQSPHQVQPVANPLSWRADDNDGNLMNQEDGPMLQRMPASRRPGQRGNLNFRPESSRIVPGDFEKIPSPD